MYKTIYFLLLLLFISLLLGCNDESSYITYNSGKYKIENNTVYSVYTNTKYKIDSKIKESEIINIYEHNNTLFLFAKYNDKVICENLSNNKIEILDITAPNNVSVSNSLITNGKIIYYKTKVGQNIYVYKYDNNKNQLIYDKAKKICDIDLVNDKLVIYDFNQQTILVYNPDGTLNYKKAFLIKKGLGNIINNQYFVINTNQNNIKTNVNITDNLTIPDNIWTKAVNKLSKKSNCYNNIHLSDGELITVFNLETQETIYFNTSNHDIMLYYADKDKFYFFVIDTYPNILIYDKTTKQTKCNYRIIKISPERYIINHKEKIYSERFS